jgi:hypothetical protein
MEEPYRVQYTKELQDLLKRARKHHAGVTV